MKAYHFLQADMTSSFGREPPWTEGETRKVTGGLILGQWGYHSSPSPEKALQLASGPVLCLVEVDSPHPGLSDGEIQCSRRRTLLTAVNVEQELHELACRIAEDVLPLYEARFPGDLRPRQVIVVKRRWLKGEATYEELDAARNAARNAIRDAEAAALKVKKKTEAVRAAASDVVNAAWAAWWAASGVLGNAAEVAGSTAWRASRGASQEKHERWINETLLAALEAQGQ